MPVLNQFIYKLRLDSRLDYILFFCGFLAKIFTIIIFSIPTVLIGVVTIFMGTKLTVAANHLEFALNNSDDKSFQIAIDQFQRYFLINGMLFIVALVFMLFLLIVISLFASVFIEFWNSQNFNYSISLIH